MGEKIVKLNYIEAACNKAETKFLSNNNKSH